MPRTHPPASLPAALEPAGRNHVLLRGRRLLYFGGCDYFRMSGHPRVLRALREGLKKHGLNVAASRMTTGNHPILERLEKSLASSFGSKTATLAPNGWLPSSMVTGALAGRFSHALLDERAHPSLADAVRLLDCPVIRFRHRDATDLARVIQRLGVIRPLLLTDGMFSHDGSIAPLKEYLTALPRGGWMLVDDAHGAGVLGRSGRGTVQLAGVSRSRIIQTITLSKAFGVFGGAVLGTAELRSDIIARSGIFTGSTPLPPPFACAALESVAILRSTSRLREKLNRNVRHLRKRLREGGIDVPENPGPIVALTPVGNSEARRLSRRLLAARIHSPFIRYPGGPEGGSFRFAISSEHNEGQLDRLADVLTARPKAVRAAPE